jgi:hypothetical protein
MLHQPSGSTSSIHLPDNKEHLGYLFKALALIFEKQDYHYPPRSPVPARHLAGVIVLADKYDVSWVLDRVYLRWAYDRDEHKVLWEWFLYCVLSNDEAMGVEATARFNEHEMPLPSEWEWEQAQALGHQAYWVFVEASHGAESWEDFKDAAWAQLRDLQINPAQLQMGQEAQSKQPSPSPDPDNSGHSQVDAQANSGSSPAQS